MSQLGGPQWPESEIERYETAHRQIQATVDRLGGEVEQMRKTLDFVRTDPCFMYLGSVTQDTVTDALGLTSILANQQGAPEK